MQSGCNGAGERAASFRRHGLKSVGFNENSPGSFQRGPMNGKTVYAKASRSTVTLQRIRYGIPLVFR